MPFLHTSTAAPVIASGGPKQPFWVRHRTLLLLATIMLFATFFRFYGREFDQQTSQHPDERFIIGETQAVTWPTSTDSLFDWHTSPLNLRRDHVGGCNNPTGCPYPYGSLPIYLQRAVGWGLDKFLPHDTPVNNAQSTYYENDWTGIQVSGRNLASFFDLISILLIFLIARRLYSSAAALITAALYAFAATAIQIAHFYVSDSFLVTFMMGALYFSVVLMQRPSWWAAAAAGLFVGLAVASKVSIVPFAAIVIAAVALRAGYRRKTRLLGAELGDPVGVRPAPARERSRSFGGHLLRGLPYIFIAGICSVLAFAVTEPYVLWSFDWRVLSTAGLQAFLETNPWWRGIEEQTAIQSGRADVPYTRQYVGTVPVLYHIEQMVFWGLGVVPGLVTVVGFVVGLWNALRRKPAEILLMSGALPYFFTISTLQAKWMRYMLPLVPIFCILGAAFLVRGALRARERYKVHPRTSPRAARLVTSQRAVFPILAVAAVSGAFLWAVAFMNIYSQPHSRVQASAWIYSNVPNGSVRSLEGWDDELPLSLPPLSGLPRDIGSHYPGAVSFSLYDYRPPQEEFDLIKGYLGQVDYVIESSNRLYSSIPRLPWAYPVQSKYYELLYAEKLGFVKVHTTQVSPELFGIQFNDQPADESFTVYDHPRVDIFKKVSTLTDDQLRSLFSTALNRPEPFIAGNKGKVADDKGLAYTQPVDTLPQLNDYAWNPLGQENTQWFAVLLWLLAAEALGFIALPIVFTVMRRLPDRGYPFAKLVALLLVSWGTWLAASARLIPFTVWSLLLMVALMAGLSLVCWRLGAGRAIGVFFRERRGLALAYEVVFLVAFGLVLWLRIANPDLWHTYQGGEKPMEFGFLNATLRSAWMPPLDPFFSGGFINYYYYGYFVVACLTKLLGINPAIAFNLAIPLLYALTFTGGMSVVYNIVAWSQRRRGSAHLVSRAGLAFGFLGAFMMLAIGNMHALMQLIMIKFPTFGQQILNWTQQLMLPEQALHEMYRTFNYWDTRSIIGGTINEYPFWTFLFADLHPHLIDMPFTLLTVGLTFNLLFAGSFRKPAALMLPLAGAGWRSRTWLRATSTLGWLWGHGWTGALTFGVTALALGVLAATNSWDFPTYAGLAGGGVLLALLMLGKHGETSDEAALGGARAEGKAARLLPVDRAAIYGVSLLSVGLLAGAALLSYLPFFLNFKAFYTAILPLVDGGTIVENGNPVAVMHRTTLAEFLVFWAFFIFIAISYLLFRLWKFPWGAAYRDLLGTAPALVRPRPQVALPQQAFHLDRPSSMRRKRRFALALAGSSGGRQASLTVPSQVFSLRGDVDRGQLDTRGLDDAGSEAVASLAEQESVTPADDAVNEADHLPENGRGYAEEWNPTPTDNWMSETQTAPTNYLKPTEYDAGPALPISVQTEPVEVGGEPRTAILPATTEQPGVLPLWTGLAMLGITAALVLLQLATGQYLLALLVALIGGIAATTLSTSRSAANLFCGLLLVAALTVAMGVELVYLADHLHGSSQFRMNTVFKFYIQVWVLFAAGSGAAVYYILYGLGEGRRARRTAVDRQAGDAVVSSAALDAPAGNEAALEPAGEGVEALYPTPSAAATPMQQEPAEAEPRNWMVWSVEHADMPVANGHAEDLLASELYEAADADNLPYTHVAVPAAEPNVLTARQGSGPHWTVGRLVWLGAFALFLASTLIFTIMGTPDRLEKRFAVTPPLGTLNGLKFMTTATYSTDVAPFPIDLKYDYAAINWLNEHVQGPQVLAELPVGYYREYGMRAAANTGLPMVVGGLHQDEQRYGWLVGDRRADMSDFFATPDPQRALLLISKYNIDYIYLGQLEQARAGSSGMQKFAQLARPDVNVLKEVFRAEGPAGIKGTIIYQVVHQPGREPETLVGAPVANSGIPGISITPLPTATATPAPTPPTDNPELARLIADVAANPTNVEARFRLVDWYRQNNFPLDAARELESIVGQDPHNIAAWHQLGDAYQGAGMSDKALKAWEDARDIAPDQPATHNKVGIAYMERQRFDDAANEFQQAVSKDPHFVEAYFHLGEAYQNKGDVQAAIGAYQKVVDNGEDQQSWVDAARQKLATLKQ